MRVSLILDQENYQGDGHVNCTRSAGSNDGHQVVAAGETAKHSMSTLGQRLAQICSKIARRAGRHHNTRNNAPFLSVVLDHIQIRIANKTNDPLIRFDVEAVRKVVAKRKLEPHVRDEQDAVFELYWDALTGSHVYVNEGSEEVPA